MNDPSHDQGPHDQERQDPEEVWLHERYPAASADFVERTLARVIADQAQIAAESQKVDEFQFDPALLGHLEVPQVAPGFVDRTLAKVMAARGIAQGQTAPGDHALEELIQHYQVPPVSEDFVRRTLNALDTGERRPAKAAIRRPASLWAAAAAMLLLAGTLVLAPRLTGPARPAERPTAVYTPVRFGSVMAASARLQGLRKGDGLVALAYLGTQRHK